MMALLILDCLDPVMKRDTIYYQIFRCAEVGRVPFLDEMNANNSLDPVVKRDTIYYQIFWCAEGGRVPFLDEMNANNSLDPVMKRGHHLLSNLLVCRGW